MEKSVIRKLALNFRNNLTEEAFNQLNHQLLLNFQTIDLNGVHTLHIFLPIAEKREPDTFAIINWVKEVHPSIRILVPRADFNSLLMTHHEYMGEGDLKKNIFNILEPQNGKMFEGKIDMVIIPLLGFDLKGNRVGYGKGFYDRFLSAFEVKQRIGLSIMSPVEQITDAGIHDIRLDACITPDKIYSF